jgi:hypothetical protein
MALTFAALALAASMLGIVPSGVDGAFPSPARADAGERDTSRQATRAVAAQRRERQTKPPAEKKKATPKKKEPKKEPREPVAESRGIDTHAVWKADTDVFPAEQLMKLEPILNASTCRDEKDGCLYQDNGKPGSEASFAFRLIPWKVSRHRSYLVRNDRCAPGGCDEGLFVLVDGRWRLVIETFGVLERASSMTLGFHDLRFKPRGQPPIRLVWDGRAYREAPVRD